MDSSIDLSRESFKAEKEFVKLIAKVFGISKNGPRGAVVLYSFFTFKQVEFDSYENLNVFNFKVDGSPRLGRNAKPRRIDLAVEEAGKLLLKSRQSWNKVIILLAGGSPSQNAGSLERAKNTVSTAGAKVYVVAFGRNVNFKQLGLLTQQPQNVFTLSSHRELESYVRPVAHRVKTTQGEKYL